MFIEVTRSGTRGLKFYQQTMYYLISQIESAYFLKKFRKGNRT